MKLLGLTIRLPASYDGWGPAMATVTQRVSERLVSIPGRPEQEQLLRPLHGTRRCGRARVVEQLLDMDVTRGCARISRLLPGS